MGQTEWQIDNKYYRADVEFKILDNCASDVTQGVEGLIMLLKADADQLDAGETWAECFKRVEEWSPAVRLLVCQRCGDEQGSTEDDRRYLDRSRVLRWCLDHELELIEMEPEHDEEDEEDFGVPRICSALQSHTWSNMCLKVDNKRTASKTIKESQVESGEKKTEKKEVKEEEEVDQLDTDFQTLLAQMTAFKSECSTKPSSEDRVAYAEKLTKAFWSVLGGEEDEFDSD